MHRRNEKKKRDYFVITSIIRKCFLENIEIRIRNPLFPLNAT